MKHKKLFLTIAAVLHFCAYSMEQPNEIPDDYFKAESGYLPKRFFNDVQLHNIYFCDVLDEYKIKESLRETSDLLSNFPELNETRSAHSAGWDTTDLITKVMERTVKVTEKKEKEAYLNSKVIFLKPKK